MCFPCCDLFSPTTATASSTSSSAHSSPALTRTSTPEAIHALSSVLSYTSPSSSSPCIKRSPSESFPHMSHSVMKILAPDIEMPPITNESDKIAYRKKQDEIINKLMQFVEEESNEKCH